MIGDTTKIFALTITEQELISEITMVPINVTAQRAWDNQLVVGFQTMTETITDKLPTGKTYRFYILNPSNPSNVLLKLRNGKVLYNFTEDFNS